MIQFKVSGNRQQGFVAEGQIEDKVYRRVCADTAEAFRFGAFLEGKEASYSRPATICESMRLRKRLEECFKWEGHLSQEITQILKALGEK